MPLGHLLDQWEIYKKFHGMTTTRKEATIDDAIPFGL